MLANLYIIDSTNTTIKFYNGEEVKEMTFDNFDKAINFTVSSGYKLKAITENDTVGTYSYWFDK